MIDENKSEFDHIVIGAGSAGCAVARRLVDAGRSVALVEAGGPTDDPRITTPSRLFELWGLPTDWGYKTVPQQYSADLEVDVPRGKVFGGSSAMYGMIHVRGAAADFDNWAYNGAPGWSYKDVLPYFIKSEDFEGGASEFHGVGGPMPVSINHEPNPLTEVFLDAAEQAGIPRNVDCNGPEILGAGQSHLNVRNGKRVTSWNAYLEPVADSPLLTVFSSARANRLMFDGDVCTGVEIEISGERTTLAAKNDVVVSAGSFGSPHLLMLSGIGNTTELADLGISSVAHLPGVGQNLQDHILVPLVFEATAPIESPRANVMEAHFFAKSDPGMLAPDIQPIMVAKSMPVRGKDLPEQAFTMLAGVIRPKSIGRVYLKSADPADLPAVDPRYLSDPQDVRAMEKAIELCREIADQPALASWRGEELSPGADVRGDELHEYIREQLLTYHHPAGTCRMGLDEQAVVDPQLRVRGLKNVRVADCSIMPAVTSGNTHAPAVMIGERAADLILSPAKTRGTNQLQGV